MFTYHGWIELKHDQFEQDWFDNTIDYPEYRKRLLAIALELEEIAEEKFNIKECDLKIIDGTNGMIAIHLSGCRNHYSFGIEDMLDWIKEKAPSSHGLIFIKDTEIDNATNSYTIAMLAKNSITRMNDSYFL